MIMSVLQLQWIASFIVFSYYFSFRHAFTMVTVIMNLVKGFLYQASQEPEVTRAGMPLQW